MAVYQGQLEPTGFLLSPSMYSRSFDNYYGDHTTCQVVSPTGVFSGVYSHKGITACASHSREGEYLPGYADLLFNKIYLKPSFIDVGQLLTNKTYSVEIWNAYLEPKTLLAVDKENTEGITFPLAPGVFKALESKTITVTFSTNGPARIDSLVTLDFGVQTPAISFSGSRLTVFSLTPNWEEGITERISYLTNIITAYDDTEQRIQLRERPRKNLAYKLTTLTAQESAFLDALLFGWQSRVYGVPVWMDAQTPTRDIISGANSIFVSTDYYRFKAGGLAIIFQDFLTFETVDIVDVKPSFITTKKPVANTWIKNKVLVIPLERGRLGDTIDFTKPTSLNTLASIAFDLEVV